MKLPNLQFLTKILPIFLSIGFAVSAIPAAAQANPNYQYLIEGKAVAGWNIQLGDPTKWDLGVTGMKGESSAGKVLMEPATYKNDGDAIRLRWTDKYNGQGNFALYGGPLDLSGVQDKVEIAYLLKIDRRPTEDVTLAIDCGWPCRGSINATSNLKKLPLHEFTVFVVPLNCFVKNKLDVKKINGPVFIGTNGKMDITLVDVRMQKMADGDKGCLEEATSSAPAK